MTGECARCRRTRTIHARGLCQHCHKAALSNGTISHWSLTPERAAARERAEVIAGHLRSGMTRSEVVALMGVSVDTVNGVARRYGIPAVPVTGPAAPPDDPACAGTNHPGFIFETGPSRHVTADLRDDIGEALTYCDRCPIRTRDWCRALVNPTRHRWTGVAGGEVYIDGTPRPEFSLEAVS